MWRHTVTHGRGSEGGNWRMEWVASTLHTTSERSISIITNADAHTSAASKWLNWLTRRFKWTRPFRRKTKCGFRACANRYRMSSTTLCSNVNNSLLHEEDTLCLTEYETFPPYILFTPLGMYCLWLSYFLGTTQWISAPRIAMEKQWLILGSVVNVLKCMEQNVTG